MQSDRLETTILSNLFYKEEYARKVLPFLKEEYFTNRIEQIIFKTQSDFIIKYNNVNKMLLSVKGRRLLRKRPNPRRVLTHVF